jgi:hypothetical protein
VDDITKKELLQIIDQMADLQKKQTRLDDERRELFDKIAVSEARHVLDIATEHDEHGKRIYTNQKMRDAAFILRVSADSEHRSLRELINGLDTEIGNAFIELARLQNRKMILLSTVGFDDDFGW